LGQSVPGQRLAMFQFLSDKLSSRLRSFAAQ
jgi:hypothetical protein